jgi:hypothetical protein
MKKHLVFLTASILVISAVAYGQSKEGGLGGDFGSKSDGVCGTAIGDCSAMSLWKYIASQMGKAAPSGTNTIGAVMLDAGTNTIGNVGLIAGTNIIGKAGTDTTTPGLTNGVTPIAGAVGGATPYHYNSAASTNATVVKAAAGTLYSITPENTNGTKYWLKIIDKATTPTCGSEAVGLSYLIPANSAGTGLTINNSVGFAFQNGISFCIVGGQDDADATNASTGIVLNFGYK